jgi:hypothetical protein
MMLCRQQFDEGGMWPGGDRPAHSIWMVPSFNEVTTALASGEINSDRTAMIALSIADCFFRREAFVFTPFRWISH